MDDVHPEIGNSIAGRNLRTAPMYAAAEHGTSKIEIRKLENKTGYFLK